jgi:hypothetical protein
MPESSSRHIERMDTDHTAQMWRTELAATKTVEPTAVMEFVDFIDFRMKCARWAA